MTRGISKARLFAALVRACALAAAACGPGVEEGPIPPATADTDVDSGADTDTDTDADTDSDIVPATCPQGPLEWCSWTPDAAHLELLAADVEDGLTFVDADYETVLGRRTVLEVPAPVVIVGAVDGENPEPLDAFWRADLAEYDGVPVVPIAITTRLDAPFDEGGARALILARTPSGNSLFRSDAHIGFDGTITPFPGGAVPGSEALRGLVYLRRKVIDSSPFEADPKFNRVCAFGDGLFCFDGTTWTTEVPAGSGASLNAVAVIDEGDTAHIIAVGDDGRAVVETDGEWQELSLGVVVDLHAVSAHEGRFTAAGGKGVMIDGTLEDQLVCQLYERALTSLGWIMGPPSESDDGGVEAPSDDLFVALATDGAILHGDIGVGEGSICDSGDAIPGAMLGRMLDIDYYVLTPQALFVRYYGNGAVIE